MPTDQCPAYLGEPRLLSPALTEFEADAALKCEKHGKKEEAVAKLQGGAKFDEVAREFSEDKARAGIVSLRGGEATS